MSCERLEHPATYAFIIDYVRDVFSIRNNNAKRKKGQIYMNEFMSYDEGLSIDEIIEIGQNIINNAERQEEVQAEQNKERKLAYDNTL